MSNGHFEVYVEGSASASCDRCGYFDSWEWESNQQPTLPTSCPDCDDAPFLARWARRLAWAWSKRGRTAEFLPSVWSGEMSDAIDFTEVLSNIVADTEGEKAGAGKPIHIPLLSAPDLCEEEEMSHE